MSGEYSLDAAEYRMPEMIKEVMKKFNVTKETAAKIIADRNVYAVERMKKWIASARKRQKEKAEDIYALTKKLKKGDSRIIEDLEKKVMELCVES